MDEIEFGKLLGQYEKVRDAEYYKYVESGNGNIEQSKREENLFENELEIFLIRKYGKDDALQIKSVFEARYRNVLMKLKCKGLTK